MKENMKEILLTEEQIQEKVKELAAVLSEEYAGKNPVFVGVLKGVVMFYADIIKRITVPCQMDFMWISSYEGDQSKKMVLKRDVSADLTSRHVVILEDIFDTGNSLNFTYQHLLSKNPASLKVCTYSKNSSDTRFTSIALSYHSFVFSGFLSKAALKV